MLSYTFIRTLIQQAVIERDYGGVDEFGADQPADWQPYLTVACRLYWDKSTGIRSADRTFVDPVRQVPLAMGGMILPAGTDVTEKDRIAQVNRWDAQAQQWVLEVSGIIEVLGVLPQDDHIELYVIRTHLGP